MPRAEPSSLKFGAAFAAGPRARACGEAGATSAGAALGSASCDLAVCFVSRDHADEIGSVADAVRSVLDPACLVCVSGESVIGGEIEAEGEAGVAVMSASLPGVSINAFPIAGLPRISSGSSASDIASAAHLTPDLRGLLLFADPFSVPMNALLPDLLEARREAGADGVPILGGMASAGTRPGTNTFVLDDQTMRSGGVGISFTGDVTIDAIVSQGCAPFGPPLVVTGCKRQLITSLAGRPAIDVLAELVQDMDPETKEKLKGGIFVGRAVNEYRDRFGRGDFLIRKLIGVDKQREALAVAELFRVGQTVQFHARDSATASEDLALLLDGQKLHGKPAGAMLFTCNGRGTRMFDSANHDVESIQRALGGGAPDGIPLAGFFAAGEIGPVGDGVFVHGQTACAALFRDRPALT